MSNPRQEPQTQTPGTHPFTRDQIERPIVERFEFVVRSYPERIAIVDRNTRLTYDMMNRAANRLAHEILECGTVEEVVPVVLGQSAATVVAAFGILKAGKAYCVLDPLHPQARLSHIIQELDAKFVVTDRANLERTNALTGNNCRCILIDDLDLDQPEDNPPPPPAGTLSAIFYTSGSTGKPKGVLHGQQSILHRVWIESSAKNISADDRFSLLFSMSFGASVTDVFTAILNGATLCVYSLRNDGIDSIAEWLNRERITIFHIPVAPARQLLAQLTPDIQFPEVRELVPSGPIYRSDLPVFRRHFPNCKLVTHMGASETSGMARMVVTDETIFDGDVVPLGYPVEDKEVLILDEKGSPVPPGQVGEIAVRSRYMSHGYWRRPDLTEKSFLADSDGRYLYRMGDLGRITRQGYIEYLGRRDDQVKIRGYRVELGEVEAALHRHEEVREAVVLARPGTAGDKKLVAWVALKNPESSRAEFRLRSALGAALPDYMVPSSIVILPALPRTDNGKVDGPRLPEPGRQRPALAAEYVAPSTEVETELAALWCELLDLENVGIHDDFLELGGHSLMAMQLVSRLLKRYEVSIAPGFLLEAPTVAQQARIIAEQIAPRDQEALLQLLNRVEGLSEDQVEQLLRDHDRRGLM